MIIPFDKNLIQVSPPHNVGSIIIIAEMDDSGAIKNRCVLCDPPWVHLSQGHKDQP